MLRQFVCLLLVCLMLANQGLCLAHSHHGTDVAESEGHASRSHFHFGHHGQPISTNDQEHHEDHSRGDHSGRDQSSNEHDAVLPPAMAPIGDHDADAVYCAESVAVARDGNSVIVPSAKHFVAAAILDVAYQNDDWLLRLGSLRGQPPSVLDAACPIYLRTLSLRI